METEKVAVLLVNVGTPDSLSVKHVRRFLSDFLNDRRVIDLPWLAQKLLVNLIIVPFRAPKSAKLYSQLWTADGSPLLLYGKSLRDNLQQQLGKEYQVFLAMRYGNPNLREALKVIEKEGFTRLVVVPLFPQYASSTSGTVIQRVFSIVQNWNVIPEVKIIGQFFNNPQFINAFVARANEFQVSDYDHILFSYHGLPLNQVNNTHPGINAATCNCTVEFPLHGRLCYKATCYETTRLIASKLKLSEIQYSVAFQSRFANNWLGPFTDKVIIEKAKMGAKRIMVMAPSFVADCLETTIEIGEEYQQLFEKHGGAKIQLVSSLNNHTLWVEALKSMIIN